MNCKQANEIPIREVLESFSLFPSKDNSRAAFYFAIDREERTPSFHVDFIKNTGFDFGTGKKYDNVSIVQTMKRCSVSDALKYLSKFDFSFQKQEVFCSRKEKEPKILKIKEVSNRALLQYLEQRKVLDQKHLLKEIYYEVKDKNYFGLGFQNDSDGWEIRNVIGKFCLGKKNITTLKNNTNSLRIFEGFFDYLTFKKLKNSLDKLPSDYLILNSVSMLFKAEKIIGNYNQIGLYLDNDPSGNLAVEKLKSKHENIFDCRDLYKDSKDLNEYLIHDFIEENQFQGRKIGR